MSGRMPPLHTPRSVCKLFVVPRADLMIDHHSVVQLRTKPYQALVGARLDQAVRCGIMVSFQSQSRAGPADRFQMVDRDLAAVKMSAADREHLV